MPLVRIDNRLIHGQIIETWIPHMRAKALIVANNELANDSMQQEIMSLAIPENIIIEFCTIQNLSQIIERLSPKHEYLVLFETCSDARNAFEGGYEFAELNVGNVHYSAGNKQISPNVALSSDDENSLRMLQKRDVILDFRCVPNDPIQVRF